ncbi:ribosome biogenesis factor YjgA [Crenothrix sp.]|uniref:ribosome biogenesis factor YjgA n=1 Tax=Crenothrix sp. TaxID=3100433 RepID=UPI00374D7121
MMEHEYLYEEQEDEVEYYAVRPNKTLIKKEIGVLFKLAEEMSVLSAAHLKSLELPEKIHNAVVEVSVMKLNGARKRLLKFIAGQLHKMDVDPILERLARIKTQSAHVVREHHITERWRDRLINDGNDALAELMEEHPQADRQKLRHLVRSAQKEAELAAPPKSSRLLYQYLKVLFSSLEDEENDDAEYDEFDDGDEEGDD